MVELELATQIAESGQLVASGVIDVETTLLKPQK